MTGPAEGKVRITASISLVVDELGEEEVPFEATTYIHLKGYANAKVTHLDFEGGDMEELAEMLELTDRDARPDIRAVNNLLYLTVRDNVLVIELPFNLPEIACRGHMGYKEGGIYLGLCRELIEALEGYAYEVSGLEPLEAD